MVVPTDGADESVLEDAFQLYATGKLRKAGKLSGEVLSRNPENARALFILGSIAARTGNFLEAANHFQKATEITNGNKFCLSGLAGAYHALGMVEAASSVYRKLLSIDQSSAEIYKNYADTLYDLGNASGSIEAYEQAIAMNPGYSEAYYGLAISSFDEDDLSRSAETMQRSLDADPGSVFARFGMAILQDLSGDPGGASVHFGHLDEHLWLKDCWEYIKSNRNPGVKLFSFSFDSLRYGLQQAETDGMVLEFGVRAGTSIRFLAPLAMQPVHGFDSFEGLPEPWENVDTGAYTVGGRIPEVPDNVQLHVGLFEETLGEFSENYDGSVRFINMDCDIYSSTRTVFDYLGDRIVTGTVIVFDEYLMNPHWREDEYRAFQEAAEKYSWHYEYLAFSPFSKQAVVKIVA